MRRWANCLIVAVSLWLASRGREYLVMRRSRAFSGLILHFLFARRSGWRTVKIVEYIPPRRARWRTDFVLLYRGYYRVTFLRVERVRQWPTLALAEADAWRS